MYSVQQQKVINVLSDLYYNMLGSHYNKYGIIWCSGQLRIKWRQPCCVDTIICIPRMGYVQEVPKVRTTLLHTS